VKELKSINGCSKFTIPYPLCWIMILQHIKIGKISGITFFQCNKAFD